MVAAEPALVDVTAEFAVVVVVVEAADMELLDAEPTADEPDEPNDGEPGTRVSLLTAELIASPLRTHRDSDVGETDGDFSEAPEGTRSPPPATALPGPPTGPPQPTHRLIDELSVDEDDEDDDVWKVTRDVVDVVGLVWW